MIGLDTNRLVRCIAQDETRVRIDAKAGCNVTMTFDRAAARDAGMKLVGS